MCWGEPLRPKTANKLQGIHREKKIIIEKADLVSQATQQRMEDQKEHHSPTQTTSISADV